MVLDRLKDRLWIQQSFILPRGKLANEEMKRRLLSNASFKFVDTTLGGNFAINAPPSYCRFADPRMGGRNGQEMAYMRSTGRFQVDPTAMADDKVDEIEEQLTTRSSGMGAYYSDAIDDNNQIVVMRFGVPAFNSLTSFFSTFYSPQAAQFARTGRAANAGAGSIIHDMFVSVSTAAGSLLGTMLALPFQPMIIMGSLYRYLAGQPASRYDYLKPAMPSYWSAVQTIVNGIGVNLGIVPQELPRGQRNLYSDDSENYPEFSPAMYEAYHRALPDIISPTGYIDVFALATKAQRRANRFNAKLTDKLENNVESMADLRRALVEVRDEFTVDSTGGKDTAGEFGTFNNYMSAFTSDALVDWFAPKVSVGATSVAEGADVEEAAFVAGAEADTLEPIGDRTQFNWGSKLWEFWQGELRDGSNFVSFRVDNTGTTSESFNNEVGESGIAQKVNSMSASARSTRFDFADGNIGAGIGTIVDSVRGFVTGALNGLQMGGLAALAGSAFVDIPQVWQNSVAQMPSASFTIQLRSPYANKLSQMQNLYIPLAMILAGGLPQLTGRHSYSQPFLVEMYCKGRSNIRLGIIDSISVERGVGNVGWNQDAMALGIDVTFSVKDLTTVMAMPLTTSSTAEKFAGAAGELIAGDAGRNIVGALSGSLFDDDNAFTDYLAALGSLGFQDMVYAGRRWRLKRIQYQRSIEDIRSPARWANFMVNATVPGRILNAIALDTDRPSTGR